MENGEFDPNPKVVFRDRHEVRLTRGGFVEQLLGHEVIRVNSLHGRGNLNLGERVVVESVAEDGTIEAIRIAEARGFTLGVQWHAEYRSQINLVNRDLFRAFDAVGAYRCAKKKVR